MTGTKPLTETYDGGSSLLRVWLPRAALAVVFLLFGGLKFTAHSMYVRIFAALVPGVLLLALVGLGWVEIARSRSGFR